MPSKNPANVLIAEDNMSDIILAKAALESDHVRLNLHHVRDGQEVLDFITHERPYHDAPRPDIIFLDINMPKIGGLDVLKLIGELEEMRDIPVCMLSGSENTKDAQQAKEFGAQHYLIKPLNYQKLAQVVDHCATLYCDKQEEHIELYCV